MRNGYARLLWLEVPVQQEELVRSVLSILPSQETWIVSDKYLYSAHWLFFLLADPHARPEDARRVLDRGNNGEIASLFIKGTTLDSFLYLWDLYSLWFQWRDEGEGTFVDFLHPTLQNTVTDVLMERLHSDMDQEKRDNLLALVGFASFIDLDLHAWDKADWRTKLPSFEELVKRASDMTCIPAVFFLLGVEKTFGERLAPDSAWQNALYKARDYDTKRTALVQLCYWVEDHAWLWKDNLI